MEFNIEEATRMLETSVRRNEQGYLGGEYATTPNVVKMTESELLTAIGVSELIRENVINLNDCNTFIAESILDDANELDTTLTENSSMGEISSAFTEMQEMLVESGDFYNIENEYLITEAVGYALFTVPNSERFISEGAIDTDSLFNELSSQATITESEMRELKLTLEQREELKKLIQSKRFDAKFDSIVGTNYNSYLNDVKKEKYPIEDIKHETAKAVEKIADIKHETTKAVEKVAVAYEKATDTVVKKDIAKVMTKLKTTIKDGSGEEVKTAVESINKFESVDALTRFIANSSATELFALGLGAVTLGVGLAKVLGTKAYNMIKGSQQRRTISKARSKFGNAVADKVKQAYRVISDKKIDARHRKQAGKFLATTISKL